MCIAPRIIVNRHYVKLAGSSSEAINLFRGRSDLFLQVDCGRCLLCQRKIQNQWRIRLIDEFRYMVQRDPDSRMRIFFVTLTIAPEFYKSSDARYGFELFRLFRERYRKLYGRSLRYWVTNEYGEKRGRLHLHAIFFNPLCDATQLPGLWKYGRCDMSVVGYSPKNPDLDPERGIAYVTSYITKTVDSWFIKWDERSQHRCSPGLGLAYCLDPSQRAWHNQSGGIFFRVDDSGQFPQALPRYYVDKLFSPLDKYHRKLLNLDRITSLPQGPFTVGRRVFYDLSSYWQFVRSIGGTPVLTNDQFDKLSSELQNMYIDLQPVVQYACPTESKPTWFDEKYEIIKKYWLRE